MSEGTTTAVPSLQTSTRHSAVSLSAELECRERPLNRTLAKRRDGPEAMARPGASLVKEVAPGALWKLMRFPVRPFDARQQHLKNGHFEKLRAEYRQAIHDPLRPGRAVGVCFFR